MITTVVRQFNRLVLDASIGVTDRVLSIAVKGDEEAMSRAAWQWDAIRDFVYRHPLRSWNPLFFFDSEMTEELQRDISNAKYEWACEREARIMDEAYPPALEPIKVADLEVLRQRFREALEQNALNTKRHLSMSDGVGDTA